MSRTYTISPDPFLVVIKDEEGNSYSCNHLDMIELDGYSVHVPGVYDWYLYFNTYAEWTKHCMDKRFKAKMFHRRGKALAKIIRAQMNPDDVLFYYRSVDDDSGVVQKRSRVKVAELPYRSEELQLTLPLYQLPIQSDSFCTALHSGDVIVLSNLICHLSYEGLLDGSALLTY